MNTTGIPVWQNGSGNSADSYTENVENQIRKADGKLKKGQRNNGPRREEKEFEERVVTINRVTKVVKGGRNMRFAALVVVGDKNDGYEFIFSDMLVGQNEEELAISYSKELEKMIKDFPLLWFNFYDFWSDKKD